MRKANYDKFPSTKLGGMLVPVSYTHLDVYKRQVQVSDITARPEYGILNKQIAIAEQEPSKIKNGNLI